MGYKGTIRILTQFRKKITKQKIQLNSNDVEKKLQNIQINYLNSKQCEKTNQTIMPRI